MFLRIETDKEVYVISLSTYRVVFFGDLVKVYEDNAKSCIPCDSFIISDIVDISLSYEEDCF